MDFMVICLLTGLFLFVIIPGRKYSANNAGYRCQKSEK
jgi:hypothetical protein